MDLSLLNIFFEEEEGGQQLRRGNVPASISKSTKKSEGETFGSTNSVDDPENPGSLKLDAKEEFDFEINSGSINATGTELTFNLTKSRKFDTEKSK